MIEVTVKTLDSQNHSFSVGDDMSVSEFKEHIASAIEIPVDKQRLIHCGRVLQDDKKLSEYNVHGKVIHVVQRAPPAAASSSSGTSANAQSHPTPEGRNLQNGNSFLLGAFSLPTDTMVEPNNVQQIVQQIVSGMGDIGRNATVMSQASEDGAAIDVHINLGAAPSHSEAQQRLDLARRMVRLANNTLQLLENPSQTTASQTTQTESETAASGTERPMDSETSTLAPNAEVESMQVDSSPENETGEVVLNSVQGPSLTVQASDLAPQNTGPNQAHMGIAQAARLAAAAALSAAVEVAGVAVSAVQGTGLRLISSNRGNSNSSTTSETAATSTTATTTAAGAQPEPTPAHIGSRWDVPPQATSQQPTNSQGGRRGPAPEELASVLDSISHLHERLAPFRNQMSTLLRQDPAFDNRERIRESQVLFNRVSEVLHYLGHAYHAVSDVRVDYNSSAPRHLQARCLMPTAALGIPIQTQLTVNAQRVPARDPTPSAEARSSTAAESSSTPPAAETVSSTASTTIPSTTTASSGPTNSSESSSHPPGLAPMFSQLLSGSNHPIVFMEVSPGTITIDSISAAVVTNPGQTPTTQTRIPFPAGTGNPFGPSFMHSYARFGSPSVTRPNSNDTNAGNSQSQARGNTTTQPTTSTQTRSTPSSLPPPFGIPPLGFGLHATFDPYLPCMSHHVHRLGNFGTPPVRPMAFSQRRFRRGRNERPPGQSQPSTSQPGSSSGASAPMPLFPDITSVISSLTGSLPSSPHGNSPITGASTIEDFIRTFPSYQESEGLFSELVMLIASRLTFTDLSAILLGNYRIINQLQVPLREFVRSRMLEDMLPNRRNGEQVVARLMSEWRPHLQESVAGIRTRDNIDFVRTVEGFARVRVTQLIVFIGSRGDTLDDRFGSAVYVLSRNMLREFFALCVRCFEGGVAGIESLIRNSASLMGEEVPPLLLEWTIVQLRHSAPHLNVSASVIDQYIVHNDAGRGSSEADVEPMESSPGSSSMDTSPVQGEADLSKSVPVAGLADDDDGDDNISLDDDNGWTRHVPQEWVPIIVQDVETQQRQPQQRPFSDAYLASMPNKRRKVNSSGSLRLPHMDARTALSETIRRAMASANVQPLTSVDALLNEVSDNPTTIAAFEGEVRSAIQTRVRSDTDFVPERYPATQAWIADDRPQENGISHLSV